MQNAIKKATTTSTSTHLSTTNKQQSAITIYLVLLSVCTYVCMRLVICNITFMPTTTTTTVTATIILHFTATSLASKCRRKYKVACDRHSGWLRLERATEMCVARQFKPKAHLNCALIVYQQR